jgi:hypothetical protein
MKTLLNILNLLNSLNSASLLALGTDCNDSTGQQIPDM